MKTFISGAVLASASLWVAPAAAQEVADCKERIFYGANRWQAVSCQVSNTTDTPIASVRYGLRLFDPARTVPWIEEGFDGPPRSLPISGGIEPGETIELNFHVGNLPSRADPAAIEAEVRIQEAFDVNGEPITE